MGGDFKKGDRVQHKCNRGKVYKVSDYGVHVIWDSEYFQVFHFKPTHHMQTPIEELEYEQQEEIQQA